MPAYRFNFFNLAVIALTTLILSGLQTTFWFQIFGSLPSPQLWLNLVLYLTLYRKPFEGILTIYLVGLILDPFTAMPLGVLWLNLLIIFALMSFVKKRVFWPSSRYFLMASFGLSLAFHISYYLLSHWLDINHASLNLFHRFFEIVFTGLTSVPMWRGRSWLEHLTRKELLPESGGAEG